MSKLEEIEARNNLHTSGIQDTEWLIGHVRELEAEVARLAKFERRFKRLKDCDISHMDVEEQCGFNEAWNIMMGEEGED